MKQLTFNSLDIHAVKFDGNIFWIKTPTNISTTIDFKNIFLLETTQTELLIDEHLSYYKHMNILSKILNKQYVKYK